MLKTSSFDENRQFWCFRLKSDFHIKSPKLEFWLKTRVLKFYIKTLCWSTKCDIPLWKRKTRVSKVKLPALVEHSAKLQFWSIKTPVLKHQTAKRISVLNLHILIIASSFELLIEPICFKHFFSLFLNCFNKFVHEISEDFKDMRFEFITNYPQRQKQWETVGHIGKVFNLANTINAPTEWSWSSGMLVNHEKPKHH